MLNLTPHAKAVHPAARFVGLPWSEDFNCWHLVQAVQKEVFGRKMPPIPIGADQNQTAALLAVTAGWSRVTPPPIDGDILTMIGPHGLHVGVWINGRVLHNLGHKDEKGVTHGGVSANEMQELGLLGYGHVKVWRAK